MLGSAAKRRPGPLLDPGSIHAVCWAPLRGRAGVGVGRGVLAGEGGAGGDVEWSQALQQVLFTYTEVI